MGMRQDEALRILGVPNAKSQDERTLRFEDRVLEFDDADRLVKIGEVLVE